MSEFNRLLRVVVVEEYTSPGICKLDLMTKTEVHTTSDRQVESQADRQADRQTDRQVESQADRQTDRQTDEQTGRQHTKQTQTYRLNVNGGEHILEHGSHQFSQLVFCCEVVQYQLGERQYALNYKLNNF